MGVLSDRKNRPHRTKINYPREPLTATMTAPTLAQVLAAGNDGGGTAITDVADVAAASLSLPTTHAKLQPVANGFSGAQLTITDSPADPNVHLVATCPTAAPGLKNFMFATTITGQLLVGPASDDLNTQDFVFSWDPTAGFVLSSAVATANNTLDDGAGNVFFAGVVNTTNTVLDDGSGNATFNGAVQATQFNTSSYSTISNLPAVQLGAYGSVITPQEGMISYDATLHKLKVYTNTGWQTVTSA